jgi:hypothetical protein
VYYANGVSTSSRFRLIEVVSGPHPVIMYSSRPSARSNAMPTRRKGNTRLHRSAVSTSGPTSGPSTRRVPRQLSFYLKSVLVD